MRESRTYGSGRGACHEMHVPTATERREFITLLGGAAVAWPLVARAQQADPSAADRRAHVFGRGRPGFTAPRDRIFAGLAGIRLDRWPQRTYRIPLGAGNTDRYRDYAAELISLAPDVILVSSGSALAAVQKATRTVPIVFVNVSDPVGAGYVASLARPGANTTGFTLFEYSIGGKWLELLKQLAPGVTRAAVIRDPSITSGTGQFGAIQAVAPPLGVELTPIDARDANEIEHAVAGSAIGGLIVTASPSAFRDRDLIIALAARHRLPAVYPTPRWPPWWPDFLRT